MWMRKNRRDGSRFWGCGAYPRCRHTEPYENDEEDRLKVRIAELEDEIHDLRFRLATRPGSQLSRADIEPEIKRAILRFHPDKNPTGKLDANEVCAELIRLREMSR